VTAGLRRRGRAFRQLRYLSPPEEIDMAMKRKAIERCAPPAPGPEGESCWHASKDIIQWLEDL